jgi:hypothetical protein
MEASSCVEGLAESGVEGSLSIRSAGPHGAVEVNRMSVPQTSTTLAATA